MQFILPHVELKSWIVHLGFEKQEHFDTKIYNWISKKFPNSNVLQSPPAHFISHPALVQPFVCIGQELVQKGRVMVSTRFYWLND
jgi:hypothetical protein